MYKRQSLDISSLDRYRAQLVDEYDRLGTLKKILECLLYTSKFKLCLRVQDKQDSKEMLHKEDAAFITQAGRGYLQFGNEEVYELSLIHI